MAQFWPTVVWKWNWCLELPDLFWKKARCLPLFIFFFLPEYGCDGRNQSSHLTPQDGNYIYWEQQSKKIGGSWISNTKEHVPALKSLCSDCYTRKINSSFVSPLHSSLNCVLTNTSLFAVESGQWLHWNWGVKEKKINNFAIFSSWKEPVWVASNQIALRAEMRHNPL